ncbi:MAG: hypothetical protein JJ971_10435 [Balneolaceae bacterium]|nr:hypothetical protein [Balneolaceae bacterium]MBO6546338.1 hypothetical protein [Balneolaceae bacterium]MBO6648697.1 hypothetical protein [Balneolaceae bacterium]
MAEYSEQDYEYAQNVINRIFEEGSIYQEYDEITLFDIEENSDAFKADILFLERINESCPTIEVNGNLIPVSLSYFLGWDFNAFISNLSKNRIYIWDELYFHYLSFFKSISPSINLRFVRRDNAVQLFKEGASKFLATRVNFFRNQNGDNSGGPGNKTLRIPPTKGRPPKATPGCNFKVITKTSGLRVFWSGAYRLSRNYFGSPTTPISSVLQSGTYIFGVDGGAYGSTIQWDNNAVISLPGKNSIQLNF